MQIIDMTNILAKDNILTGISADTRVIMSIWNGDYDIYSEPRWIIPKEKF